MLLFVSLIIHTQKARLRPAEGTQASLYVLGGETPKLLIISYIMGGG